MGGETDDELIKGAPLESTCTAAEVIRIRGLGSPVVADDQPVRWRGGCPAVIGQTVWDVRVP